MSGIVNKVKEALGGRDDTTNPGASTYDSSTAGYNSTSGNKTNLAAGGARDPALGDPAGVSGANHQHRHPEKYGPSAPGSYGGETITGSELNDDSASGGPLVGDDVARGGAGRTGTAATGTGAESRLQNDYENGATGTTGTTGTTNASTGGYNTRSKAGRDTEDALATGASATAVDETGTRRHHHRETTAGQDTLGNTGSTTGYGTSTGTGRNTDGNDIVHAGDHHTRTANILDPHVKLGGKGYETVGSESVGAGYVDNTGAGSRTTGTGTTTGTGISGRGANSTSTTKYDTTTGTGTGNAYGSRTGPDASFEDAAGTGAAAGLGTAALERERGNKTGNDTSGTTGTRSGYGSTAGATTGSTTGATTSGYGSGTTGAAGTGASAGSTNLSERESGIGSAAHEASKSDGKYKTLSSGTPSGVKP